MTLQDIVEKLLQAFDAAIDTISNLFYLVYTTDIKEPGTALGTGILIIAAVILVAMPVIKFNNWLQGKYNRFLDSKRNEAGKLPFYCRDGFLIFLVLVLILFVAVVYMASTEV